QRPEARLPLPHGSSRLRRHPPPGTPGPPPRFAAPHLSLRRADPRGAGSMKGETLAPLGADILQARAKDNEAIMTAGPHSLQAHEATAHHDYLQKRAAYYFPAHN